MKYLLIFVFNLMLFGNLNAQEFISHKVEKNESLKSLARQYNTSVLTLKKLNPNIDDFNEIESQNVLVPQNQNFEFSPSLELRAYEVSPKETLYSISRKYNLKVKDLVKYNPYLADRELNMNDVLRIPVYKVDNEDLDFNQSVKNSQFSTLMHLVLPKETKYGISKKYGLSISELENLNPGIEEEEIQPGQFLKIQRKSYAQKELPKAKNKDYKFLELKSSSSLKSILDEYEVTKEELFEVNPSLKNEGVSDGLVIKIPQFEDASKTEYKKLNLEEELQYFSTKTIGLMLPFSMDKFRNDTINPEKLIKKDKLLQISLDFYEGVQMAIDSARAKNINVNLKVFDTKRNPNRVQKIIEHDFSNYDAVVGPLLDENLKIVSSALLKDSIPVITPLVNPDFEFYNLFKTLPEPSAMQEALISYINSTKDSVNLIVLADSLSQNIERKYAYTFPDAKFVEQEDGEYLQKSDLKPHLVKDKTNWFILETESLGIAESAVSFLKSFQRDDYKVRLFTSNRSSFYEDEISNYYLSDLNFTFPSVSKFYLDIDEGNFSTNYKNEHGYYPNRYVIRGFDVMYDLLLRLASSENLYESTIFNGYTEYFENKFHYTQNEFSIGYSNDAIYLIQYLKNLDTALIDLESILKAAAE
ncbi:amino acid ABC transporter substrate-binding protein [Psychroflexus aestuariivivens]|uniref:amino acid ABC transporter substrate-binding protein n=1 Tax=Psychroflexus aestuariivivens TaxID=1795040 RepID=UPI001F0304D0|nr:LysM peptidoglycan-binding domain-containing protein [Psychroflexus aestuariivivens]